MAQMTLDQICNRVAVNTQDVTADNSVPPVVTPVFRYWSHASIVDWVNDGNDEVCAEVQLIQQYITFALNPSPIIAGNATAEWVPSPVRGVPIAPTPGNLDQLVMLQCDNVLLEQWSPQQAAEQYWDWDTRTGTPKGFLYNTFAPGVIKLIPDPGTNTANVRGIATLKPSLLVAPGDVPPFDSAYHVALVYFATAQCFAMDSETEDEQKFALWMGRYQAKLAKLKTKQSRNFSLTSGTIGHDNF